MPPLAVSGVRLGAAAVLLVLTATAAAQETLSAPVEAAVTEAVAPPGLPAIGKWMITRDGTIAHWLGEIYQGRRLREPINVVFVDTVAASEAEARRRLVEAATAAGYPARIGHSTGYRAFIGGRLFAQLPDGRDQAFSNRIFELTNNHGRLFGPYPAGDSYVSIGALSREDVRPLRWPEHGYASFNRARDDFAHALDRYTGFKLRGYVDLQNAITDDPQVTTGDHDGRAALLRAER